MREIKFRAFVDGEMYPVTNLDYIQDGSGIIAHIHVKGINQEIPSGQFKLMQYTGLKDKNGKEIYEGDIVRSGFSTAVVKWDDDIDQDFYWGNACGFSFNFDPETMDVNGIPVHYEVIGNIFEGVDK